MAQLLFGHYLGLLLHSKVLLGGLLYNENIFAQYKCRPVAKGGRGGAAPPLGKCSPPLAKLVS